jgi:hypothetical protein
MASDNGFADAVVDVEGGEGDVKPGTPAFERSPLKVLASLSERPLQQAIKAIEYIDGCRERERKFLKACSPSALNLIASNGPEYLTAVQAISN